MFLNTQKLKQLYERNFILHVFYMFCLRFTHHMKVDTPKQKENSGRVVALCSLYEFP